MPIFRSDETSIDQNIVAVVAGPNVLAEGLRDILGPEIFSLSDPDATVVSTQLQIRSAPFAFHVNNGQVVRKRFLRNATDLTDFLNGGSSWSEVQSTSRDGVYHGT